MVYIHLNQKIQKLLPKNLPKSIKPIELDGRKYLSYKEFKQVAKKFKIQLHKFIHRTDIVSDSEMQFKMQLTRRTPLQRKIILQLRSRQQYKKNNPSLADQISFLCKEAVYQTNNEKLADQVSSAGKMIFSMCMSSIVGYLVAQNGLGLDSLSSLCVGGCLAGVVCLYSTVYKARDSHKKTS